MVGMLWSRRDEVYKVGWENGMEKRGWEDGMSKRDGRQVDCWEGRIALMGRWDEWVGIVDAGVSFSEERRGKEGVESQAT